MASGRIRRSARRGLAVAVLGWLGVAALSVVMAPAATAAGTYTVHIRDLTPPVASVDQGGLVTFINEIPDKTVQVGGGGGVLPSLVSVTAKTVVTLTLPSGDHQLAPAPDPTKPPNESVFTEKFTSTCVTCKITYTYALSSGSSLTSAVTDAATKALPALPVPTPFVVNTLVPLPNLPSVNLPQLPQVNVPLPTLPGGTTPVPPVDGPGGPPPSNGPTPTNISGIDGNVYAYETGGAGPQLRPAGVAAASAFDPSRFAVTSSSSSGGGSGASTGAGGYDGASVPVFGQLAGLDGSGPDSKGAMRDASSTSPAQTLPAAALAAVIALAAVTAALVRTHQASRSSR